MIMKTEKKTNAKDQRLAFTMIELLVVIAIIAILAAVLLPVLQHAKQSSMGIKCMSNMRQMALGWQMYAQENKECIVMASMDGGSPAQNPLNAYAWTKQEEDYSANAYNYDPTVDITVGPLYPYINDYHVYRCPADTSVVNSPNGVMPRVRTVSMNTYLGGFGGQCASGAYPTVNDYPIYMKTTDLIAGQSPGPANTFVFLDERQDCINWGNYMTDMTGDNGDLPPTTGAYEFTQDMPGMYHNLAAGFAFADGHSEIHKWLDHRTTPPLDHSLRVHA